MPKERKRSFNRLDALPSKSNADLSVLEEGDEEEGATEGPTPQRRRRERERGSDPSSHLAGCMDVRMRRLAHLVCRSVPCLHQRRLCMRAS